MLKFINLFCFLLILIAPISSQQHYDKSNCTSEMQYPGSNYLCNAEKSPCETFIIYRAKNSYRTLTSISSLFNTNTSHLLMYNNMSQTDPNNLHPGRDIIVPVTCSCPDRVSEAFFTYNASKEQSLSAIACEVFEGLVKAQTLADNNQEFSKDDGKFYEIEVPVKCACVDTSDVRNGVNFLVTYPVIRTDSTDLIAQKFGVPEEMILSANGLGHFDAIFPQTTLIIPMTNVPVLHLDVSFSPPSASLRPEGPPDNHIRVENLKNLKVILGGVIFLTVLLLLIFIVTGVLIVARKKIDCHRFDTSSSRTSKFSDLSPDFFDNILKFKHALTCYRMEELRVATKDFNESLGSKVYKGRIGNADVAIKQIESIEEANRVISILTKINHINVLKPEGCCFELNNYLVYEFVKNGSLRNCISNPTVAKQLTWDRRVQIALDIAEGLHYIHYCTRPSYIHHNINSKTILITENYRAKISGFRNAKYRSCGEDAKGMRTEDTAVDVYAFGLIVVELLSGNQIMLLKNFLRILGYKELQESPKNLEKLNTLIDPVMEKDYSLEASVFLACLARACLEEDPLERPSMNDVVRALSRTL